MCIPVERTAELWPRTGLWGGEEDTERRSRIDLSGDLLAPSIRCNSAPESRRQSCAKSPGTAEQRMIKTRRNLKDGYQNVKPKTASLVKLHQVHLLLPHASDDPYLHWPWQQSDPNSWRGLQRRSRLLAAKMTGRNYSEASRRFIRWITAARGVAGALPFYRHLAH